MSGVTVNGPRGMVTSLHYLASEAGSSVLRAGGNAVDAAVATSLALNVVMPHMCGIGGEGRALIHLRDSGDTNVINWSARTPRRATPDMFELLPEAERVVLGASVPLTGWAAVKDDANEHGPLAALVPGAPAGYELMLQRHGSMAFEDVAAPAIALAEDGFPITAAFARHVGENADLLHRYPSTAEVFLADGYQRRWGLMGPERWLVQRDLGQTLRTIAREGARAFYRGEVAQRIADFMQRSGGLIDAVDLAEYQAEVLDPSRGSFRGMTTYGVPGGGTTVVQVLNILDGFDLEGEPLSSPRILHLFLEAVRVAFKDRVRHMSGDLDLVPWRGLASKEHAAELRAQINPDKATPIEVEVRSDPRTFDGDTTHLCVVDKDRNVVSSTLTLGSAFGSRVVLPGTGILLNGLMHSLNPEPGDINSIGPGKRRRIPHAASILVRDDGRPFMAVGSPGGEKQIVATLQTILGVMLHGLSVQDAIDAPRVFRGLRDDIYVSHLLPEPSIAALQEMGHKVVPKVKQVFGFGRPNGIVIDGDGDGFGTGSLDGGADKDTDGKAVLA